MRGTLCNLSDKPCIPVILYRKKKFSRWRKKMFCHHGLYCVKETENEKWWNRILRHLVFPLFWFVVLLLWERRDKPREQINNIIIISSCFLKKKINQSINQSYKIQNVCFTTSFDICKEWSNVYPNNEMSQSGYFFSDTLYMLINVYA